LGKRACFGFSFSNISWSLYRHAFAEYAHKSRAKSEVFRGFNGHVLVPFSCEDVSSPSGLRMTINMVI